jgi:hypothetical protein
MDCLAYAIKVTRNLVDALAYACGRQSVFGSCSEFVLYLHEALPYTYLGTRPYFN